MADFAISVVVMSAILAFTSYASYPTSSGGAAKFAASVLLLYVVTNPLGEILSAVADGGLDFSHTLDTVPEIGEDGEYVKVAEEAFEEGISKLLFTKYGIKPENAHIQTEGFDFQGMRCEKIKITLFDAGMLADFRAIEEYISESGLGDCEVSLSFG